MKNRQFSFVDILKMILGSAMVAAAFQFFTFPNSIVSGGVTGIAQIVHLLSVDASRETGYLRERPVPGIVGIVAFVCLETHRADADSLLRMMFDKQAPGFRYEEIGGDSIPDLEITAVLE